MCEVIVFSGTYEGFEISRFLSRHGIRTISCMATEYGSRSLREENLEVHTGRMDAEEMMALLQAETPCLVIDATHPYAAEVTRELKKACEEQKIELVRLLRESCAERSKGSGLQAVCAERSEGEARDACTGGFEGSGQAVCVEGSEGSGQVIYVKDVPEAVAWLENTEGNILLTTGSKELASFTVLSSFRERLYVRVLPLASVMESCKTLGFEGRHVIGMQGPFSRELNEAMLKQYDCRYLVTKDTGVAGGFPEKIDACLDSGVSCIVIGRPVKEDGYSLGELMHLLSERFHLTVERRISIVGIGMGSEDLMTGEARKAVREAQLVIGAERITKAVRRPGQEAFTAYRPEEIAAFLDSHPEYERIAIVFSGDVGFFSGAKKLLAELEKKNWETEVFCGISSVSYFMAKAGLSWDDAVIVSVHGKTEHLVSRIYRNKKVFGLLGKSEDISTLSQKLCDYGLGDVRIYVGEHLSYPEECIFSCPAKELVSYEGDPLSVFCAVNENPSVPLATHGLDDEAFERGKVPMTKAEVRAVSLAKLGLLADSICYDIGAGTGSAAVEMAIRAERGLVYAIEKKEEALVLVEANRRRHAVDNLIPVAGEAVDCIPRLPAPTHVFIGGSGGHLREILGMVFRKNPGVTVVINCITLETLSEAVMWIREQEGIHAEIVSVQVARSSEAGAYHLMRGENPVYIIRLRRFFTPLQAA